MTANEYFGDWIDVIDKEELRKVVTWARPLPSKRSSYWNTVW